MKAVWFDDQVEDALGRFLERAFADLDIDLIPIRVWDSESMFNGVAEGISLMPDLAVVDMRLGEGGERVSGIDLIQHLSSQWVGPVVVLTRYPKHEEIKNYVDPLIPLTEVIKPDSADADEMASWFRQEMQPSLGMHLDRSEPAQEMALDDDTARAYLQRSFDQVAEWSFEERMGAKEKCASVVLKRFEGSFVDPEASYLIVAGWPPRVLRVGRGNDDPPSREYLRDLQRRHGEVVLVVRRPSMVSVLTVDDPTPCVPTAGPAKQSAQHDDWFPVLQVEIKNTDFRIHLDTGSDYTFLGYETLGDVVPGRDDPDDWSLMNLKVGLGPSRPLQVSEWRVKLGARSRAGQLQEAVPVQLVYDFANSGLDAACTNICPAFDEGITNCRFRPGLLGRDILRHTGWVLVIDTASQRAFVLKPDDELLKGERAERRRWFSGG